MDTLGLNAFETPHTIPIILRHRRILIEHRESEIGDRRAYAWIRNEGNRAVIEYGNSTVLPTQQQSPPVAYPVGPVDGRL